jgi:hypothetical protein
MNGSHRDVTADHGRWEKFRKKQSAFAIDLSRCSHFRLDARPLMQRAEHPYHRVGIQ